MSKVADNLRRAANELLWDGRGTRATDGTQCKYSCGAVGTLLCNWGFSPEDDFLCMVSNGFAPFQSGNAMAEFAKGEERQGVRYAWLMFAADIAEEWNIE